MPLTAQQLADLNAAVDAIANAVSGLTADGVNPLQAQLDAVTAERDGLQVKIDAVRKKLQDAATADAAEDSARNDALTILS